MVGLLLIALGTGGIKPCVAAFGGDQFEDHQVIKKKKRNVFLTQTLKSEDKDPAELIHRSLTSNIFSFSYIIITHFQIEFDISS